MSRNTSNTAAPITDEQLLAQLDVALTAARKELAEIDPRRDALVARIAQLEATVAVFKGETPAPKRRASKRRAKRAASTPEPTPAAETTNA